MDITKGYQVLNDKDDLVMTAKQVQQYKNIVISETLNIKPQQFFEGDVRKSGNGAIIPFKRKFIGRKVYIILRK